MPQGCTRTEAKTRARGFQNLGQGVKGCRDDVSARLYAILLLKHNLLASMSATWARYSSYCCPMLDPHRANL